MENEVALYIYVNNVAKRIELFGDEKISVTNSIQNANDLGKVFTEYSQSFTIPANDYNNSIFSHWYESNVDNGYDHRVRYKAFIEINTLPFKDGQVKLEKANRKNGFIDSYTVTFYGLTAQIKELFKEDKLNTLDYSGFIHNYNSTEVISRITSTTEIVKYPLIGANKKFYYKYGSTTDDITLSTGAIRWDHLFPALPVEQIFYLLLQKYGLSFSGSFMQYAQFKKLHLLCKNDELPSPLPSIATLYYTTALWLIEFYKLQINWYTWQSGLTQKKQKVTLQLNGSNTVPATVKVYDNGVLYQTFSNLTLASTIVIYEKTLAQDNLNHLFTFKVFTETSTGFNSTLTLLRTYGSNFQFTDVNNTTNANNSTLPIMDLQYFVPDMTIYDFFQGIIKMFNLMIVPKTNTQFELVPLELYYQTGKVIDITPYAYADENYINAPLLYKSINFKYQKSENILNTQFSKLNGLEYGDLIYTNPQSNESTVYDIALPFENLMFERARVGTTVYNFSTATCLNKDLQPYTPKPVLIYNNGVLPTNLSGTDRIYVTTSTTPTVINNYNRFSNEYALVPTDLNSLMSINFGEFQSPWNYQLASNSLYNRHYRLYIENLYNLKTRTYKYKALLPDLLFNQKATNSFGKKLALNLNDRVVIRDKRFIINTITTDLTTGESDLELISDYREINQPLTIGYRFSSSDNVELTNEATEYEMVIYKNEFDSFDVSGDKTFVSYSDSSNNTEDLIITISVVANLSGVARTNEINVDYFTDGVSQRIQLYITQLP